MLRSDLTHQAGPVILGRIQNGFSLSVSDHHPLPSIYPFSFLAGVLEGHTSRPVRESAVCYVGILHRLHCQRVGGRTSTHRGGALPAYFNGHAGEHASTLILSSGGRARPIKRVIQWQPTKGRFEATLLLERVCKISSAAFVINSGRTARLRLSSGSI
jgi:hypothetical protein